MGKRRIIPFLTAILISVIFVFPAVTSTQASDATDYFPSNDCYACHTSFDDALNNPPTWFGGIEHNQVIPCPALAKVNEELYYTERLLVAINRTQDNLPVSYNDNKAEKRLIEAQQNYSRVLDTPITSLEAFIKENQSIRYELGKVYTSFSRSIDASKRVRIIWFSVIISIVVIGSLTWGWLNTKKGIKSYQFSSNTSRKFKFGWIVILLTIFLIFALPIFRLPKIEDELPSTEEQERSASVDEARRAALTADKELSKSWILAKIGSIWVKSNPSQGYAALEEALSTADEAQLNADSLWGFSQNAWEASGLEENSIANADIIASSIDSVRGRAWAYRAIAEIWLNVDEAESVSILGKAENQITNAVYPYDQLDLRSISEIWARINPEKGFEVARKIINPAIRSWAYREIGEITGDENSYAEAISAAREVINPVDKSRCLWKIGVITNDKSLINEAIDVLSEVNGTLNAYGLADLAINVGDSSIASQISKQHPDARTLAYYGLGEYEKAWTAAEGIADPIKQARAQSVIAGAWGNSEAADQITYSLYQDRALRDITINTGQLSLVEAIHDSYYKIQILTSMGEFEAAWELTDTLYDDYPLVTLGAMWIESNPSAVEEILNQMTMESDKAVVLKAIAAKTGSQEDFERALGMALAARIRGDALSPVKATLSLADAVAKYPEQYMTALGQAYDTAQMISIIY